MMKCTEAIRVAMVLDQVTQAEMARRLRYRTPSAVENAISRKHGMRLDVFIRFANALGYEVVMRRGEGEDIVLSDADTDP